MVELQLSADVTDMMSDTDTPETDGLRMYGASFPWNLVCDAMHRASSCVKSVSAALVMLALSSTTSRNGEVRGARWGGGGSILSSLLLLLPAS